MLTPFLVAALIFGQSAEDNAELPPMSAGDLEWVGRYVAKPSGKEDSPRSDMELWLFENGRFYWVGTYGSGEWRRVGEDLVLLPHTFFNNEFTFGGWQASLDQFRSQAYKSSDSEFSTYHLKRVKGGFETTKWPFSTFARSWQFEEPDMEKFVAAVKGFGSAFADATSSEDSAETADREVELGDQYMYVSEHLSGKPIDELAAVIAEASKEEVAFILTGLFLRNQTEAYEQAVLKFVKDDSMDRMTRHFALNEFNVGASRESLEEIWSLRDNPEIGRTVDSVIATAIRERRESGFQSYARMIAKSAKSQLAREQALEYLGWFPEEGDFELGLELADGGSEEAHMAKRLVIATKPESDEARKFFAELELQVAELKSNEEYKGDLHAAALVVSEFGTRAHWPILKRYAEETGRLYVLLKFVERTELREALPFLKIRLEEMDISLGKEVYEVIQKLQGKQIR